MYSKNKKQGIKELSRQSILDAAFDILKSEGWQALSMRKIAEMIQYTVPVIYEHFSGKEDVLLAFAKKGFSILVHKVQQAKDKHVLASEQLKAMWLAYWDFSNQEKELYQIMFGVKMKRYESEDTLLEVDKGIQIFLSTISELTGLISSKDSDEILIKFYTFWSLFHGLISFNMVQDQEFDELNAQVLNDAIDAIIKSMEK